MPDVAIDSDNENSTLKRFHPDTRFLDLSKRRDLDAIFAALAKTNLVVVDCRAASTDLFIDLFNEIDLPAMLSAFDAKLTLIMPVNHESDMRKRCELGQLALRLDFSLELHGIIAGENSFLKQFRPVARPA